MNFRQAAILWRRQAPDHAARRASLPQGAEQPGGEFTFAIPEARANPARISVDRIAAAFRLDLLSRPKPLRPLQIKSLRLPDPILPPGRHGRMDDRRPRDRLKFRSQLPRACTSNNVTVSDLVHARLFSAANHRRHGQPVDPNSPIPTGRSGGFQRKRGRREGVPIVSHATWSR